jgi:hypothetical protein
VCRTRGSAVVARPTGPVPRPITALSAQVDGPLAFVATTASAGRTLTPSRSGAFRRRPARGQGARCWECGRSPEPGEERGLQGLVGTTVVVGEPHENRPGRSGDRDRGDPCDHDGARSFHRRGLVHPCTPRRGQIFTLGRGNPGFRRSYPGSPGSAGGEQENAHDAPVPGRARLEADRAASLCTEMGVLTGVRHSLAQDETASAACLTGSHALHGHGRDIGSDEDLSRRLSPSRDLRSGRPARPP